MWIWLFASIVHASGCPASISAERWSTQLHQLQEDALFGADGADQALARLTDDALCVDAPISSAELAALWLARGSWEVLTNATGPNTRDYFANAWAIGGEAAWDPSYGTKVQAWFYESAPSGPPAALLIYEPNDVMALDGVVIYDAGPFTLTPGEHLVQWSVDGVWRGVWIHLGPGEQKLLGAALPVHVEPPVPDAPRRSEGPGTVRAGGQLSAGVAGLYAVGTLRDAEGLSYGVEGVDGAPLLATEIWLGSDRFWGRFTAVGVRAPTLADLAWPRALGLYGGVGLHVAGLRIDAGIGARAINLPLQVAAGYFGDSGAPEFDIAPAMTGAALVEVHAGGKLGLDGCLNAELGRLAVGGELGLGPFWAINDTISLTTTASAGAMALREQEGVVRWWSATGGTRWSF